MPNVPGRWLEKQSIWRKLSLNTWVEPNNATIYGFLDVDMGKLTAFLDKRREETGVKVTVTHAVSRALSIIMKRYPECNVLVRGRRVWLRRDVDIFHQVAIPLEGGTDERADLSGVTIRNVDTKRVEQIAQELRDKAKKVRARQDGEMARTRNLLFTLPNFILKPTLVVIEFLTYFLNLKLPTVPRDTFGGAMVTAVGMFGIKTALAPIVTFSKAPLVMLVGEVEDRVVVRDGQMVIRPMCTITATIDHRVIDGFQGGVLARWIVKLLENPELLDEDPADL